jgi:hypothetical protein
MSIYCAVVEVRNLEDAFGTTCGRSVRAYCSDCGVSLCSAHAEWCDLCRAIFCSSCLSFHERECDKPVQPDKRMPERKSA